MLSQEQSDNLETLQKRALKIIFENKNNVRYSYEELLEKSGIPRLSTRREDMFKKFALKASKNEKISNDWFPKNDRNVYNIRNPLVYCETTARTERLKNSPIFQMRTRLNQMHES